MIKPQKFEAPPNRHPSGRPERQTLRFSPTAWAKLLFFRDTGNTEIGGFGLADTDDLLLVEEFITIEQSTTAASIEFDDQAVADFFDAQIDAGRQPNQFARIWIHTHPGDSPQPSAVDEECFQRVFGLCGHAVMFIVAQGGKTYARIELNVGPGGSLLLPMEVDYRHPFVASDHGAWQTEYDANIHAQKSCASPANLQREGAEGFYLADYWAQELAEMEPDERQAVLADLGSDPDAWPEALYW